jgi:DNA invertase Pin-like site-specific DNA recombinase
MLLNPPCLLPKKYSQERSQWKAATSRITAFRRASRPRVDWAWDAQKETVHAFLNGGSWDLIGEYVEVETGRAINRPQLAKALAQCRVMAATLIVANVSRLTRSVSFLSRLLDAGVDVRFCDLPQIEGPTGRFMLQQMAAVAELEAGLIGDRTRKALAAAKARGVKLGNPQNLKRARLRQRQRLRGPREAGGCACG